MVRHKVDRAKVFDDLLTGLYRLNMPWQNDVDLTRLHRIPCLALGEAGSGETKKEYLLFCRDKEGKGYSRK